MKNPFKSKKEKTIVEEVSEEVVEKPVKKKAPAVKKEVGLSERLLVANWDLYSDRKYLFTKEGKVAKFAAESIAKQTQKRFGGRIVEEKGLFLIKK